MKSQGKLNNKESFMTDATSVFQSPSPDANNAATRRLVWIDIAKGIAILLVITGHTVSVGSPLVPMIFMFHMPLFFIMAGYTYKIKPLKTVVLTSAKRLLIPYVIIFVLWQGYTLIQQANVFTLDTLVTLGIRFIFASGSPNETMGVTDVGMAWFLMCLFVSRVLLNLILSCCERYHLTLPIQAIIFIALAALGIVIGEKLQIFLPFDFDLALITVGFMWCGYTARKTDFLAKFGFRLPVLLGALAIYVAAFSLSYLELAMRLYGIAPLCIAGALAGSLLACWVSTLIERTSKLLTKCFVFLGQNSMLIYCFHCMDWFIPWKTLPALDYLPFKQGIAIALRTLYAILLTLLVKRV